MSRRTVAALTILVMVGLGVWLIGGAPRQLTVAYDLGEARAEVTRLTVRYQDPDAARPWRVSTWSFPAGEAPRRVSHRLRLPRRPVPCRITVERGEASVTEERQLDGAARGDQVVVHLGAG